MNTKKALCILLALLLTLSLLPTSAWAVDSEVPGGTFTGPLYTVDAAEYIPGRGEAVPPLSLDSNGYVKLKETNEVRWIDRLDLTGADSTMWFYDWLIENSDGDGTEDLLIDPTAAESDGNGGYLHTFEDLPFALDFSYRASDDPYSIASGVVGDTINHIVSAFYAFDRDHPEVFWLDGGIVYGNSYSVNSINLNEAAMTGTVSGTLTVYFYLIYPDFDFDIRSSDYRSADSIYSSIADRDGYVDTILSQVPTGASRYETLRTLNNWLTAHNAYNSSNYLSSSVIGDDPWECICALEGRVGLEGPVCESYSRAFKVLCDRLDIPCVLVDGANHMWNYVQMEDGKWYAVDVTWNDPNPGYVALSGYEHEGYLLVGSSTVIWGSTFISEHPVQNTPSSDTNIRFTNGPVLSETAFDPNAPIPHTHSYGAPVFTWQSDYSACVVSATCSGCEDGTEGHRLTADCTITTSAAGNTLTVTAAALLGDEEVSEDQVIRAEMGEGTVTITLPMVCEHMYVLVVSYNSAGQMTGCQMLTADQATLEAETNGTRVSIFFPDIEDYTPHLGVWNLN